MLSIATSLPCAIIFNPKVSAPAHSPMLLSRPWGPPTISTDSFSLAAPTSGLYLQSEFSGLRVRLTQIFGLRVVQFAFDIQVLIIIMILVGRCSKDRGKKQALRL